MEQKDAIRARYPNCRISGSGVWASVAKCSGSTEVTLFGSARAAQEYAINRCDSLPGCTHDHHVAHFPVPLSISDDWRDPYENDKDDRRWKKEHGW